MIKYLTDLQPNNRREILIQIIIQCSSDNNIIQRLVIKNERHCLYNFMEDGNSFQELKMTDQYVNSLSVEIFIILVGGKWIMLSNNSSIYKLKTQTSH